MARIRETALYYEPAAEQPGRSSEETTRILGVKNTLVRMGISIRNVPAAAVGQSVGSLLGRKNFPACETEITAHENAAGINTSTTSVTASLPINEPVLLLDGLTGKRLNILLRELRKSGVSLPCKAVVTDSNIHWSFVQLYQELVAEREAMTPQAGIDGTTTGETATESPSEAIHAATTPTE